jgi:hypothetical protein
VVDPTRATEPLTIVTAAWLSVGPQSVVTGPTAAFLHGLTALPPTPVHLALPYETHKSKRAGVVIHNGADLQRDREERHGLPVLCLERVVSDLVCKAEPPDALALLDEVLARALEEVRPAVRRALRRRLQQRPDPRGTRIGSRLVDLATGRAESPAESWLLWRVVDLGFPVPKVNVPVRDLDGRERYRIDLAWPELRIAIEYNGYAAHLGRENEDAARISDLERRGWIVIVVDAGDLARTTRLEKELDEAFAKRGFDLRGRTIGLLRPRRHRDRDAR